MSVIIVWPSILSLILWLLLAQMNFVLQVTFDDGEVYSWHKVSSTQWMTLLFMQASCL